MQPDMKTAGLIIPEAEDVPTIGRYALGGAAVGGGAAALLKLIQYMRLQRRLSKERERIYNPKDTDENTIVLTLPAKQADAEKEAVIKEEGGEYVLYTHDGSKVLGRHKSQKEALAQEHAIQMSKHANDPSTFALSWLAALAGGAGMYRLVNKIYHDRLLKDIKQQEAAARTQLLDQLTAPKTASEKTAEPTFSYIDAPIGMGLLLTLLGTGATGYITKKILDEHFRQADREKFEVPKATRIVFRTQPATEEAVAQEGAKLASEEDVDTLRAAIVLHMVKASGDMSIFEDAEVKAAMEKTGQTQTGLMGLTGHPTLQGLFSTLLGNVDVRRAVQRAYMQDHPVLKHFQWALKVPGLNNIADRMTYSRLGMQPKTASLGLPTLSGVVNAALGNILTESQDGKPAAEEAVQENKPDPEAVANSIQLSARDPVAQLFLKQKQLEIRKLLRELAAANAA